MLLPRTINKSLHDKSY